ncbi:DUF4249 family protein [Chitinophaga vietnamensis]|uniref:DUF4249 family protein n=1 Tax=Chitinophaga vietnamensis TaxID=2593957 RepID=UPI001177576F|nr:DUF4249 family protein [Chitinophaga vietnamensis]
MKRLIKILPFGLFVFAACQQQLPVPGNNGKPRTVVYSELIAGNTPEVRIGKTKPVGPGVDNNFELVENANVTLLANRTGNTPLETLSLVKDSTSNLSRYAGVQKLEAGKYYRVTAMVPGMRSCTATAFIPPPIKVELVDTFRTMLNGRPVLRFHLNITLAPGNIPQYIAMEALKQTGYGDTVFTYNGVTNRKSENPDLYNQLKDKPGFTQHKDTLFINDYLRIPCYTQDENADNNQVGGLNENYNNILFSRMGRTFSTNLYINATALSSSPAEEIAPKGRVLVYVKSVSRDYYDFLLTYEKVKRNPGLNSLIQAIQIRSNTSGGVGIVGGCNETEYRLYYDTL